MLIRLDERALLIECKYSWQASVVARAGYEQALATPPKPTASPQARSPASSLVQRAS